MIMIDRRDGKTSIEVLGNTSEIARELMELLVNLSLTMEEQLDVKGMVQDDELWGSVTAALFLRRGEVNEQAKEPERKADGAESKE